MKKIILAALLLAAVAQAQPPANQVNTVPACTPSNTRTCIGGADPGRSAWILDGGEGYFCIQNQSGECVPAGGAGGGGDAGMFAFCAGGAKGIDYNAQNNTYAATCGNYPWSAEVGGTIAAGSGRVADFSSPTTSGGNGYYIDCTGPGVGVGQDGAVLNPATALELGGGTFTAGSTTTVLNDTGAGYAVNALRGYIIRITSGAQIDTERYVVSNTADSITVGTAFAGAPVAAVTYTVRNPIGTVCYAAGERVKINFMADAMLAQEMTSEGGKVYFPNFEGKNHGIYVNNSCGRKGYGPATTPPVFNNCPVLRGTKLDQSLGRSAQDNHYQRYVDMGMRNIEWVFQGRDGDTFANNGVGRSNVYVVEDTGGFGSANHFYDAADGVDLGNGGQTWMLRIGGAGAFPNQCVPISATDPRCDVTTQTEFWDYGYNLSRDSRSWTAGAAAHSADVVDPAAFCVTDQVGAAGGGNEGVCEDDPRILCNVAGSAARTSATVGGCNFGAGGDLGPCVSFADAIAAWNDTRPDRIRNYIHLQQGIHLFPGSAFLGGEAYAARIGSVPGVACGTSGATLSIGTGPAADQWILPIGAFDFGPTATLGWLSPDFFSWKGGVRGGTWIPNNFFGRDVDADGVADVAADCFSGGTMSNTDDEAVCEGKTLVSLYMTAGAGMQDAVVAYGSQSGGNAASWFDGSIHGTQNYVNDLVLTRGKRGAVGDWSNLNIRSLLVEDNNNVGPIAAIDFVSKATMENVIFRQNTAAGTAVVFIGAGNHSIHKHIMMDGNDSSAGQIRITTVGSGSDVFFDDIRCNGGDLPCVSIVNSSAGTAGNISLNGLRVYGTPSSWFNGTHFVQQVMPAAVDFSQFAVANAPGIIRNVSITDARMDTSVNNSCLVGFDDDPTALAPINTMRATVSIRDSSIDQVLGATGAKAICVAAHSGYATAANDTGMQNERFSPIWTNVRVDGVAIPDQPWPVVGEASVPVCAGPYLGTTVQIHDDTTALGTCDDGAGTGNFIGGGTFRSVCKCVAPNAWNPF